MFLYTADAILSSYLDIWTLISYIVPWTYLTNHLKQHLDRVSHFSTKHAGFYQTDGQTDRQNDNGTRPARIGRLYAVSATRPNEK